MRSILIPLICAWILTRCASSSMTYTPPNHFPVQTSKAIQTPFDEFWDLYVAELSKSFFVINNIEKESRIINVSFSSNNPKDYVDCGRTTRTSKHPATGTRTWRYATAESSSFAMGIKGTNLEAQVSRNTSLEGRVNIFMAPEGGNTKLTVNSKYIWKVTSTTVDPRNPYSRIPATTVVDFSSTQKGSHTDSEGALSCVSTGVLEDSLLNITS